MYATEKYSWFWPPAFEPGVEQPELAWILATLRAKQGVRLLDLACGQGWLTIPLALHGLQVTGLDLSAALLERAARAAEKAGIEVEWVRGDMRALSSEWSERFDFVTFRLPQKINIQI